MKIKLYLLVLVSLTLALSGFADSTKIKGNFKGKTISVKLIGGAQYETLYNAMIPAWEKDTGGKVEVLSKKSHFALDKEIKQDIASGKISYCLASNHTSFSPQYPGMYRDLNQLLNKNFLAAFTSLSLKHSVLDNELVLLPRHSDISNLYYQKSLYRSAKNKTNFKKKYGYALAPPETWDQFKDQAIFFSNPPNFYGTLYVGKEEAVVGRFYELLVANGGQMFDKEYRSKINSPEGVMTLNWFVDLYKANAVPKGVVNYLWDDTGLGFASGTIALNLDWGGWAGFFNDPKNSKIANNVGIISAPKGKAGIRTGWSGSHGFSITKACREANMAVSLLSYLVSNEGQTVEAMRGLSPTRTAVWDIAIKKFKKDKNDYMVKIFQTYRQSLKEDAFVPPLIPEWTEVANVIYPELQAAILSRKTVKQALDDAQEKVTEVMEDGGYY